MSASRECPQEIQLRQQLIPSCGLVMSARTRAPITTFTNPNHQTKGRFIMSSDRKAVNREYKGAPTGHQDENVTGKPVKTAPEPQDRQRNSSTLDVQVRDITVDAEKWASDRGGLSTAFG